MTDIQTITLTPWHGGECPVEKDTPTIVRYADGRTSLLFMPQLSPASWQHIGPWSHITAYAAIRTEVASPRVDRSARGWVVMEYVRGELGAWWASSEGLSMYREGLQYYSWDECEKQGWFVRRMTPADLEVQDE